jgi:peptidoglycan hydrolase-like protein with peptidoglycan-binding domain
VTVVGAVLVAAALVVAVIVLVGGGSNDEVSSTRATSTSRAPTTTSPSTTIPSTIPSSTSIPVTTVVPSTAAVARAVLRAGSRGTDVVALQQRLIALGYNPGTPDGDFGTATTAAVIAFQKAKGLPADGVVGSTTWDALNAAQ